MAAKRKTQNKPSVSQEDVAPERRKQDPVTKYMNVMDRMIDDLSTKQLKLVMWYVGSKEQNTEFAKFLNPKLLED